MAENRLAHNNKLRLALVAASLRAPAEGASEILHSSLVTQQSV
jgi:hypothetical protein